MINKKPYIIAEVSSNWNSTEDLFKSITAAKEAGADAVKFQLFTHKELYGYNEETSTLNKHSLDRSLVPRLSLFANEVGIDFMCSAFGPEGYTFLDPFVSMHKVASAEMMDVDILEAVSRSGKHCCISTGGHSLDEVSSILGSKLIKSPQDITLMYCVADYPAHTINLNIIEKMKQRFGTSVGYSDHTTDVLMIPRIAVVNYGAEVIEKHFNAVGCVGPDSGHSLNPVEFRLMVDSINGITSHAPVESEMRSKWRRRLMVTSDILEGTELVYGINFGSYRSKVQLDISECFLPQEWSRVNGLRVKHGMVKGTPLSRKNVYGF